MPAEKFDFPAVPQPSRLTLRGRVATATLSRLDTIVDSASAAAAAQLSSYADRGVRADERGQTAAAAAAMLHAMAGQAPHAPLMAHLASGGARRGVEGFPLHEILRGFDLVAGIVWDCALLELQRSESTPAERGEASMQMSIALLESTSRLSGIVSDAFVEAEREQRSTGEQLRRDVFEDLLNGSPLGLQALRDRAQRAGYPLGEAHGVLVGIIEGELTPRLDELVRKLAGALRANSFGAGTPLVQVRGASVTAIIPTPPGTHDGVLLAGTQVALSQLPVPPGVSILCAVGRVESAMPGIPTSYRQAQRALGAARATAIHSGVVSYAEMLATLLLLEDPRLALDTYRATIEPLHVHDERHGSELVTTLDAFLAERGALAATAKRLYVHRHTLGPRLERIEEVSGFSLRSRGDLLMLELGLQARKLLHESASATPVVGRPQARQQDKGTAEPHLRPAERRSSSPARGCVTRTRGLKPRGTS